MGDSGARDHQRTARPRGDAQHEPVRSRRALCPRQGQALEQGRAAAHAGSAKGRCAFRISARAADMAFSGIAGASRRCRRGSATTSSAPPTSSTRWTPASRRSAPTRMNCRWSTPRSPTTTRRCAMRPITCCATGRACTAAICWSCCPIASAPPRSSSRRPTGSPTGKARVRIRSRRSPPRAS